MAKLLSQVSFEVSTRVRFVRNEPDEKHEIKKQTTKKDALRPKSECLADSTEQVSPSDSADPKESSES
jgi:hypothetical protein